MRVLVTFILFATGAAWDASASHLETADLLGGDSAWHTLRVSPPQPFGVDSRMNRNVEFWIRIYSQYYTYQGLIHDAKYIDHVYEVLDFQRSGQSETRRVREAKRKWRDVLLSVHHKGDRIDLMNDEERRVFQMFQDVNEPNKFLNAAHRKRLRFQLGQKDRFIEGLYYSGQYLPVMEEIFRREGLPVELTRLPFVESSFNVRAQSKVGASGIWQFMRSTGKLFLKINDAVDERNDPVRATEAAARLLRMNFDSLKSWSLAVTAYNHGRLGMMRAVRRVGSDQIEDVVSGYRSRSFGFASGNFFTELLASIEVERNAEKYFGQVNRLRPRSYIEAEIPDYIDIRELSRFLHLDLGELRELNPGLTEAVYRGERYLPARYRLRLPFDGKGAPEAAVRIFTAGYAQIPAMFKLKAQRQAKYGTGETSRKKGRAPRVARPMLIQKKKGK